MINKIILEQLKDVKDVGTYLTILYGISNNSDFKLFRDCKKEFADLKNKFLIETDGTKVKLTVPFYENEMFKIQKKIDKENQIDLTAINVAKKEIVEEWINDYRALFPLRNVTGLTYHVKGDLNECIKRMKKFIQDYKYSKETILQATKNYIEEQKNKGWSYTKKAHKFIRDLDGSILSEYCEAVKKGDNNKPMSQFNVV